MKFVKYLSYLYVNATDSHNQDISFIDKLIQPISEPIRHITGGAAYESNPTYHKLTKKIS